MNTYFYFCLYHTTYSSHLKLFVNITYKIHTSLAHEGNTNYVTIKNDTINGNDYSSQTLIVKILIPRRQHALIHSFFHVYSKYYLHYVSLIYSWTYSHEEMNINPCPTGASLLSGKRDNKDNDKY